MKKKRFKINTRHLLVILTIVCLSLIAVTITDVVSIGPVRQAASTVVVPFQKGINTVGRWLTNQKASFDDVQELSAENEELRNRIKELEEENISLSLGVKELDRLKSLYNIDQEYKDFDKVAATVISKDPGNWYSTFVIDRGSKDGIAVDMNVISGGGLVGIVTEVGSNWATVRSIMDDSSNISAMTVTNYDTCIVSGNLTLADEGLLSFDQMKTENNVLSGERIVTSNISDKYIKGIPIGTISEVNNDSNNLTKTGTIIPAVDFRNVQEVLVILNVKGNIKEN